MATIKPIEGRSVHHIQSGQVIVDLCSVVKELLENSVDAGATSIDIRFKNNGLDSIEVQDNGAGIAPEDFETIALKHYTSKLTSYDDLSALTTFGFRGEALSSLCALSDFHITTARAESAPKGNKLEFETSGKLKDVTVVASQKGTTVAVENIFRNLPVRRKELEKNIKREYSKVLGLLHAYACISINTKISVSNIPVKGKKTIVFSTKANPTTRENIANVYGAKTLLALVPLELHLQMNPTTIRKPGAGIQDRDGSSRDVHIVGHISRPVVGEGRQAPDRQMFFVNGRPCMLPQISKAMNEVYKSYNVTQSAFIFADLRMDTEAYDVNVSPDKREILLHDQVELLEELKTELHRVFESHDQSVPQAQLSNQKLPNFRPHSIIREKSVVPDSEAYDGNTSVPSEPDTNRVTERPAVTIAATTASQHTEPQVNLLRNFISRGTEDRDEVSRQNSTRSRDGPLSARTVPIQKASPSGFHTAAEVLHQEQIQRLNGTDDVEKAASGEFDSPAASKRSLTISKPVQDFNARMASQARQKQVAAQVRAEEDTDEEETQDEEEIPSVRTSPVKPTPGVVQNAFNRMRPQRTPVETAVITIGDVTTTAQIGNSATKRRRIDISSHNLNGQKQFQSSPSFRKSLRSFAAPGTGNGESSESEADGQEVAEEDSMDESSAPTGTVALASMTRTDDAEMVDMEDPSRKPNTEPKLFIASDEDSDDEYVDEQEKKDREEEKIARMIAHVEAAAARPSHNNLKRANAALKGKLRKDATLQLMCTVDTSLQEIEENIGVIRKLLNETSDTVPDHPSLTRLTSDDASAEQRLSLTVSKPDFARMRIVGQFNLGFILAVRPAKKEANCEEETPPEARPPSDELFIIDQHASDEKYNFERLQSETIVQHQRLVQPKRLDLTAIEEEIILERPEALLKNGFVVDTDESGESPTGRRCSLISLPMSREVVFDVRDLEELLALLAESAGSEPPRPSKVRRMFAMRACRGSIMVGKTLTTKQMEKVVRHMGEIDKPWNCPHGRPTMRHLYGLNGWESWTEGDGLMGMDDGSYSGKGDWASFLGAKDDDEDEIEDD